MTLNAIGLLFGAAFGFVLGWARLTDYEVVRNMLLLRDVNVFLIIGSAIMTAGIGVRLLRGFGVRAIVGRAPVSWKVETPRARHVNGSILFGLGWSIAATCPGPVAAQIGRGQFAGLFTISGLLAGIVVCDRLRARQPAVEPRGARRETPAAVGL